MEMTMKLVRKDFMHLGYSLKSLLIGWLVLCTFLPLINLGVALAMPALGAYLSFYSLMSYEEKNKGNLLTSALPVSRKSMCQAQYIETFIYIIGGMICSTIGLRLKGLVDMVDLSLAISVGFMFGIALTYTAIILPCVFHFGTAKSRYILAATYGGAFGLATSLNMAGDSGLLQGIKNIGSGISGILLIGMAVLLWGISYFISLKIFANKDFK